MSRPEIRRTPWTPYGVTFTGDGTRLVIGGGGYYGGGGVVLVDLASGEQALWPCAGLPAGVLGDRPPGLTVSGVCLSADDRHLVATTWSTAHHRGPTLVYAVDGLDLACTGVIGTAAHGLDLTPTGGVLHDGRVIVRLRRSGSVMLALGDLPAGVHRRPAPPHLTGHRVAVLGDPAGDTAGDTAWTGAGGALLALGLDGGAARTIPVPGSRKITAIAPTADGTSLVTGGLDGELDVWSPGPPPRRIREPRPGTGHGVVGVCTLAGGDRLAAVTEGGLLSTWRPADPRTGSVQLPEPGRARAIAAHPHSGVVAVAIKQPPAGAVLLTSP